MAGVFLAMMPTSSSVPGPTRGAAALTDGVDAPANTEADAAVAAPGQHLVPVHAPRGCQVRRSLLAALAIAVLPRRRWLRCPRRIRQPPWSRWPTWRPTRIRRWPGCRPPRRSAGYPPSAPGSSPGMTWPWRSCVMRGRTRSMTLVSPRPRWSGRACSRWTARSMRATGVRSTASSGATRSTRGSPRSPGPRLAAWCQPSSRAVRPNCAGPWPGRWPSRSWRRPSGSAAPIPSGSWPGTTGSWPRCRPKPRRPRR